MKRRSSPDLDVSICKKEGAHHEEGLENKIKKNKKAKREDICVKTDDIDEMAFTKSLRDSDVLRAKIERERLEFEKEKLRVEAEERRMDREERAKIREEERAERRADREASSALELQKFKLMMETLTSVNK